MTLLLTAINSKYIHSNLAIHSIKAYAKEYADAIEIEEYTINMPLEQVLRSIYKKQPKVIAFSCYIWNITYLKQLITELGKVMPKVPIWLGGPEVTYNGEEQMAILPNIKGIVIGEGEATFTELLEHYIDRKKSLNDIQGLIYRDESGKIICTDPRPLLDMDELVFPYEDLKLFEHRIIYYESARGCPFRCSYCLSSGENQTRFRSFSLVKKELDFFLKAKVKQVKFVDRTFNCDKKHALEIWEYLYANDNGYTNFHFEISADLIDEEMLRFLKKIRPGQFQFEIGVQSTYEPTLDTIQRKMDLERLGQVVATLKDYHNIHLHLDLIAGLPKEDYPQFRTSFNDVYALRPEQLQLGFLKVLKGTKMHREGKRYGLIYQSLPPFEVLASACLPYSDLLKLKSVEEMVEIYYNSGQFTYSIGYLETLFPTPFDLFEALGEYYEKKGLSILQHARMTKYNILIDFYHDTFQEVPLTFKLLLLIDLYLQENLKKRPTWYEENNQFKEAIKKFYNNPVLRQKYLPEYAEYEGKQVQRMTHIEPIPIDLSRWLFKTKEKQGPSFLLFNYAKRDPLTHHATMSFLSTLT